MIWPFKRKAKPQPSVEDLRDGAVWLVGDLAVCISDDWRGKGPFPQCGHVYRVLEVRDHIKAESAITGGPVRSIWLGLEGMPATTVWQSHGFRKAVQDHNACEDEFRIAMRDLIKGPVA